MNDFEIRSYTKKDLALRYFPSATPHTAVNRLMSWICRCQPLTAALAKQGYRKTSKWFSAREVRLIVEYLGGPWSIGSSDHRNLNGIYTDVLGVAYGKKSLGEIFFKMLLRKKYFREIAILNRFLGCLGPQILHEDFLQDFLPAGN